MTARSPTDAVASSMPETPQVAPSPRADFELLRPFDKSELVIGLIGPLGAKLETVRNLLAERLQRTGYEVINIRVTEEVIRQVAHVAPHSATDFEGRTKAFMDAGNEARLRSGDNGVLALGVATAIAAKRRLAAAKQSPPQRRAYIVSSLKHPEEVKTLRHIYPEGFYLIGVHEDRDRRFDHLVNGHGVNKERARALMDRDEDEHLKHGQRVTDTFHLSDFFVRMDGNDDRLKNSLWRIIELLFGNPFMTPTFDEYAMFMAFAASLRSADLSRQVGAVVAKDEQVLSTGANDCPRYGGGLYWPALNRDSGISEDVPEGRDFVRGYDSNVVERLRIMNEIIEAAKGAIDDPEKLKSFEEAIQVGRVRDLTEYGRVVHAEMEALLSCGRAGVRTTGATLYGTTFPCHNCAKHIIAAGISRVVFIEPYQKSKAFEFHSEAIEVGFQGMGPPQPKIQFEPFVGVGPRRFFDLFSTRLGSGYELVRKLDETGVKKPFILESARLRLQMLPHSYLAVEDEAAASFRRTLLPGGSNDAS